MYKKKILKNFSWLLFDNICRVFIGLFVGIWVARYLGPNNYGILNYAVAYIAFFSFLSKIGLDPIVVRELAKSVHNKNALLGTSFILKLTGGTLSVIFIYLTIIIVKSNDILTQHFVVILSFSYIFISFDVVDFYFRSKLLSKSIALSRIASLVLSSGIKIVLIVLNKPLMYFAIASLIDFILTSLLFIYSYHLSKQSIKKWVFEWGVARLLLIDSWPIMISTFLIFIFLKVDQIMIDYFLNPTQVGIYSVAVRISEAWYFLPQIIASTLMPYFIELKNKNNDYYEKQIIHAYSVVFYMGIIVGISTIILGKYFILYTFGNQYIDAYKALIFNIWAGIFVAQSSIRGVWIVIENLQRYRILINFLSLGINIGLNCVLIPILGINGAAITTLFTRGLNNWLLPFFFQPLRITAYNSIRAINPIYLINK